MATQTSAGKRLQGAARGGFANRYFPRCDAWIRGLLVLNVPNTAECVPFEQLVGRATRLRRAQRQNVNGKELIVVQLFFERPKTGKGSSWNVEIDFDPAVNYLVRKTVYAYSNGKYQREDEVTQFKEYAPGLFFPELLVGRSGPEGKVDFSHTTVISGIRLNEPLPSDALRLRFPYGVYLTDSIRGVRYRVNQEGTPISPEEPIQSGRVIPPPSPGEDPATDAKAETREEPRSVTRWILPVSLGILVVGIIGTLIRRQKRKAVEV